jgi:hypothetical protein
MDHLGGAISIVRPECCTEAQIEGGWSPLSLRNLARPISVSFLLVCSIPAAEATARAGEVEPLGPSDREALRSYVRDTWRWVAAMGEGGELPADGLRRLPDGTWQASPKTSPTDFASYFWSTIAAQRLGIISQEESLRRLGRTLAALERIERFHGFFPDWIDRATGKRLLRSPYDNQQIEPLLSSVDNAWLATALVMIGNACPRLRERARALLGPMDFAFFYVPYDPAEPAARPGLLRGPYWLDRRSFGGLQRILNTEQRIAVYLGIARGQLPPETYFRPARTLPRDRLGQGQNPHGENRTYLGIRVYEGYYRYRGMRVVPTWIGSMFEALMVTLFVPEEARGPRSWGVNHRLYVRAQIEHGLREAR